MTVQSHRNIGDLIKVVSVDIPCCRIAVNLTLYLLVAIRQN